MSAARYLKSIGGNASVSAASLANAAAVFSIYNMADFGFYSLVLIFSTLVFSVINALFVASMQDYVTNAELLDVDLAAFVMSNLAIVCVMALLFGGYTEFAFDQWSLTVAVTVFLLVSGLRWLVKSYRQMLADVNGYALSDALLAIGLFLTAAAAFILKFELVVFFWLMSLVQIFSMFALKTSVLFKTLALFRFDMLVKIKEGYVQRGRDALIGSFTLELSQNSHSYLISIFAGPQAFAPIALANLMFRPFAVVMAGLVQSERPLLSTLLSEKQFAQAKACCRKLRRIVLICLLVNIVLLALALYCFDDVIAEKVGDFEAFVMILGVMVLICSLRAFRFPIALQFQSLGAYGVLKWAVIASGVASFLSVSGFIALGYFQASIIGLLLGEAVMFVYLNRLLKRHVYEY